MEDAGSIDICVILYGRLGIDLEVQLRTHEGTAEG